MSARPLVELNSLERDTLRMNIKTLEERASVSREVVISDRMAQSVARFLRRLLPKGER